MDHVGRRTIYLYGFFIMFLILLCVGSRGIAPRSDASVAGSLLLVYTFSYNFTVGSIGYTIVAEVSSQRLKTNIVTLARHVCDIFCY
jgi:MFS transporter, SP family, general alpha glucoside:H+ symporter